MLDPNPLNLILRSVAPNVGGNIGLVTLDVRGFNFDDSATIRLETASVPSSGVVRKVERIDATRMLVTFDLTDVTRSVCDVVVEKPSGACVTNGFHIM